MLHSHHRRCGMNFFNKIKSKIPALLLGGLTVLGISSSADKKSDIAENNAKPAQKTEVVNSKVKKPIFTVFYFTDTIEKRSPILLFNNRRTIIRHYRANDELYRMRIHLFAHEAWHTHNLNTGFRDKYKLSPKQYRKLLSHDEISADLVALNTQILEYELSDDKTEFLKKYNNSFYSFYFKEVAKGEIDPSSTNPKMREKDYKLRINGIMKAWMERSYESYSGRHHVMLFNYIRRYGLYGSHNKNYQMLLHRMYTIGGIDFWKYAEQDIKTNDVDLFNNLTKIKSFPKKDGTIIEEIKKFAPLLEEITDDNQRTAAVQHLIISSEIKAKIINNSYDIDHKIANILYNKTYTKYMQDENFADFAAQASLLSKKIRINEVEPKISLDDFIEKTYSLNGVDLSKIINNFSSENIPYTPDKLALNFEAESNNIVLWNDLNEMLAANIKLQKENTGADKPKNKYTPEVHSRRSGIQSVELPNFEEPILVALTAEQTELIRQTYKKFYASNETQNTTKRQAAEKQRKSAPTNRKKRER